MKLYWVFSGASSEPPRWLIMKGGHAPTLYLPALCTASRYFGCRGNLNFFCFLCRYRGFSRKKKEMPYQEKRSRSSRHLRTLRLRRSVLYISKNAIMIWSAK